MVTPRGHSGDGRPSRRLLPSSLGARLHLGDRPPAARRPKHRRESVASLRSAERASPSLPRQRVRRRGARRRGRRASLGEPLGQPLGEPLRLGLARRLAEPEEEPVRGHHDDDEGEDRLPEEAVLDDDGAVQVGLRGRWGAAVWGVPRRRGGAERLLSAPLRQTSSPRRPASCRRAQGAQSRRRGRAASSTW